MHSLTWSILNLKSLTWKPRKFLDAFCFRYKGWQSHIHKHTYTQTDRQKDWLTDWQIYTDTKPDTDTHSCYVDSLTILDYILELCARKIFLFSFVPQHLLPDLSNQDPTWSQNRDSQTHISKSLEESWKNLWLKLLWLGQSHPPGSTLSEAHPLPAEVMISPTILWHPFPVLATHYSGLHCKEPHLKGYPS